MNSPKRKNPYRVYSLDGDKMKFRYTTKERVGGNGFGLSEEGCMYTLNTIDQHMVAIVYNERAGEPNTFRVGKKANIRRLTNRQ